MWQRMQLISHAYLFRWSSKIKKMNILDTIIYANRLSSYVDLINVCNGPGNKNFLITI